MADYVAVPASTTPRDGLVTLTHFLYLLHAFSALMGVLGTAFVLTAFLTGWPSIIAAIINYIKRGEVRGTYLDSHFGWQLRTFWYAVLWVVVAGILIVTVVGIFFGWGVLIATGLWVLYRIVRGWIALVDRKPMPLP